MNLLAPEKITLYGEKDCPACKELKRKLDEARWPHEYVEVDVHAPGGEGQGRLRQEFPKWGGYVPVLVIDKLCMELGQASLWDSFAPWSLANNGKKKT